MKLASAWGFVASVIALTAVLYFTQSLKTPEPSPSATPSPSPEQGPVVRVGFFEIGPDDAEPVLVHELAAPIPGTVDVQETVGKGPLYRVSLSTSLNFGINFTGQPLSRVASGAIEPGGAFYSAQGSAERHEDGSYSISLKGGDKSSMGSRGYDKDGRLREGEVKVLSMPGYSGYSGGLWSITFVLARISPAGEAGGTIEGWRRSIIRSCSDPELAKGFPHGNGMRGSQALYSGVKAAGWFACPEAREALAGLAASPGAPDPGLARRMVGPEDLQAARLMAGDAGAGFGRLNSSRYMTWPALAASLKHPALREGLRPEVQRFIEELGPGPSVAARLREDPALKVPATVRTLSPWLEVHATGIIAAVLFLIIAGFSISFGLSAPADLRSAASLLSAGCLLSLFGVTFNQVNLAQLLALVVIAVGVAKLAKALGFRTPAVSTAMAATALLLAGQAWLLVGAPGAVASFAELVHDGLPLTLLAALGPVLGDATGASWGLLKTHAVSSSVPAAAFLLWEGINRGTGTWERVQMNSAVGWGLLVVGIVSAATGPIGWWGLRKRLKTIAIADPVVSAQP